MKTYIIVVFLPLVMTVALIAILKELIVVSWNMGKDYIDEEFNK